MKKKIIYIMTMMLVILTMIITIIPRARATGQYAFSYTFSQNGIPPFYINGTTIYCRQSGGSLHSDYVDVPYYIVGGGTMSPGLAYALNEASSDNVRQNIIWLSELSNNTGTIHFKDGQAEARELLEQRERFDEYYKKLQSNNKEVKINDTDPKLVDSEEGMYKVGPFSLDFYKSEFSNLKDMKIELSKTDSKDTKTIGIDQIDFGNFKGDITKIEPNEEFYVLFKIENAEDYDRAKLKVEYQYKEATGTYTNYQADPPTRAGYTIQRLISINTSGGNKSDDDISDEIKLTIDLAGRVFLDKLAFKDGNVNGILDQNDEMLNDIEVTLFDSDDNEIAKTKTKTTNVDGKEITGYYEFKQVSAAKKYYVRFKYNGQLYEPTTYQTLQKIKDENGNKEKTSIEERSYATDGYKNREKFNKKFDNVTATSNYPSRDDKTNVIFQIYAYTGRDGKDDLKYYSVKNSKKELKNINFGIVEREEFDLNLRKDLVKVDVSINNKSQTYNYKRGEDQLVVDLRGTDLAVYERKLRRADLEYQDTDRNGENKLKVRVTYKIQIMNETINGHSPITGYVTNLTDYYDSDYTFVRSYDENNKDITWGEEQVHGEYKTRSTTALANEGIDSLKYVFVEMDVKAEALAELLNTREDIKYNYAEITGYRNEYKEERKDLNGQTISPAKFVSGLLDKDSKPGNFDPSDEKLQEFIRYSLTDEYKNKSGAEKTQMSRQYFEDDADMAPGLKLILDESKRLINGNVWEDSALAEKLQENIRLGNGTREAEEKLIKGIKVELIETRKLEVGEVAISASTDTNGYYQLEGYIPGDYIVRFRYGEGDTLIASNNSGIAYTGQDYKSTIYDSSSYQADEYWYSKAEESQYVNKSDAGDNWDRRQETDEAYQVLNNHKAEVLNYRAQSYDANDIMLKELEDTTKMWADTEKMNLEVEYLKDESKQDHYEVKGIDFGIIERPRSELTLNKEVSHIKVYTNDGQTLFDTDKKVSNLAWDKSQVQVTVDENLLHGSTLEATYRFKIVNTGERDYNNKEFYYLGKITTEDEIVKTKPTEVIDYIANNVDFNKDREENKQWTIVTPSDLQKNSVESLVSDKITTLAENKVIVKASTNNPLIARELVPEYNGAKGNNTTEESKILVTKVLNSDSDDTLRYENVAEIVQSTNGVGRRSYDSIVSIPGNLDPVSRTTANEPDTGNAQPITVLLPFGKTNVIWYIIGIIALAGVLGIGIYIIRYKVLINRK